MKNEEAEKVLLAKLAGYIYEKEYDFGDKDTHILYGRAPFENNPELEDVISLGTTWDPKNDWNTLMDIVEYVEKHYIKSHYGVNIFRKTCTLYKDGVFTNSTETKKESTYYTLLKLAKEMYEVH